jgi:hypothetical protein
MDFSIFLFYPIALVFGFFAALVPKGRLRLLQRLLWSALASAACALVTFGPYLLGPLPQGGLMRALAGPILMMALGVAGGFIGSAFRWFKGENWEL